MKQVAELLLLYLTKLVYESLYRKRTRKIKQWGKNMTIDQRDRWAETTICKLEKSYIEGRKQFEGLKRSDKNRMSTGEVYYVFDDIEHKGISLDWYKDDVELIDQLFHEGWTVNEIAERFKRKDDEVAILIMDRAIKGFINIEKRLN